MQRRGVKVSVVSTISSQPPMIADELRRQADEFVDITQLLPRIGRESTDRPADRPADRQPVPRRAGGEDEEE